MKKIIMVRHATAAPKGVDVDDFTRSLRKKGHRECRAMIRWYQENVGDKPDLMLSSPANRAMETALSFAKGLGYKAKKIARNDALYGTATPEDSLNVLKSLDDECDSVMVFGHDPAFSQFAQYMVDEFDAVLPKCSIFAFGVNRKSWKAIKAGDGKLEYFESPAGLHQLRSRAKQARREAAERVEQGIWKALEELGVDRSGEDVDGSAKVIRRASVRVVKSIAPRLGVPHVPETEDGEHSGEETTE
jgi:phosphohistidine phosphatase